MTKINKLTAEQEAKFPEYVKKWTEIGLCTEPANRAEAEEGIKEAYVIAGLKEPKIVWCDSPLSMGLTRAIVQKHGDKIKTQPGKNVRDSVWDSVGDSVWDSVRDSVGASGYGQHDANWIGFYDYFNNEVNLKDQTAKLSGLTKITKNAGWYLPHENICWVSERHGTLHQDSQNRLHCEFGPAVEYPDGWALYYWHGVKVTEQIIMQPDTITPESILSEQNAEVRRVMAERFGFRKFGQSLIDGGKAKLINEQEVWGEPVRYYHYNDGKATLGFVHVINGTIEPDGTKHEFILTVKANNENALDAVFSTYPDLMDRIKDRSDKWEIIKQSVRT